MEIGRERSGGGAGLPGKTCLMRPSALAVIIALAVAPPPTALPRLPPLFEELLKKNRRRSILRKLNFLREVYGISSFPPPALEDEVLSNGLPKKPLANDLNSYAFGATIRDTTLGWDP